MNVISSSKITKISSKVIAMKLIYYETASKNIHMITFLGDSGNKDFSSYLHVHHLKFKNHENIIESNCYGTLILWISIEKWTYYHIFRGFWEQWFSSCLHERYLKFKIHKNIIESDCYGTYILWISIKKYTYDHIFKGFWEHWFFINVHANIIFIKLKYHKKYYQKQFLWDLYFMNPHQNCTLDIIYGALVGNLSLSFYGWLDMGWVGLG